MAQITFRNNTKEVVRLAIFRVPVINPTLSTIAWRIAEPPPGGTQTVEIPAGFTVFAKYSTDPTKPSHLDAETAHVAFAETTARFSVDALTSQDHATSAAVINQHFDGLVMNEVRITNNYPLGVLLAIAQDGDPILEPQVVWPGGLFLEDVRGSLYVAVVAEFVSKGQRLVQEEVSLTQMEVLEGGTITVSGSMWTGYALVAS